MLRIHRFLSWLKRPRKNSFGWLLAGALFAIGLSCPAKAEDQPTAALARPFNNASLDRKRLVEKNLPLTESEARRFWPLYERYQKELYEWAARRKALIARFGENYENMSDELAKQLVYEHIQMQESRLKLLKAYLPKFGRVLPPRKLMRYYQIETKIRAAVDAEIAERIPLLQ